MGNGLNLDRKISKGIVMTYIRLGVYLFIGLIFPPFLLKTVGVVDNGLYAFAQSIISFFALLSFGTENSYIRFLSKYEKEEGEDGVRKVNGIFQLLFGIIGLLIIGVSILFALLYGNGLIHYEGMSSLSNGKLLRLILILGIGAAFDFCLSIYTWYIYYRSHFVFEQLLYLSAHVFSVVISIVLLHFGYGVIFVAFTGIACTIFFDLVGAFYAMLKLKMPFRFSLKGIIGPLMKEILVFSVFLFMSLLVSKINLDSGKILLGHFGSELMVLLFGYGSQFFVYESQMSQAISNTFSPKIHRAVANEEDPQPIFDRASFLVLSVIFLVIGGFIASGHPFLNAWLGGGELTSDDLTSVYLISIGFLCLFIFSLSLAPALEISKGRNKHAFLSVFSLISSLVGVGISLICTLLFPENIKIYGPLIGIGSSTIATTIAAFIFYRKKLGLSFYRYWINFLKTSMPALISAAVVLPLFNFVIEFPEGFNLWLVFVIEGASYVILFVGIYLLFNINLVKRLAKDKKKD